MASVGIPQPDVEQAAVTSNNSQRWLTLKKPLYFAISLLVFILVYTKLPESVAYKPRVTLAITLGAIMLWVLEPIPFSMTAALLLILLPVSGAVSTDFVLSGFASPAIFLIVAGMMMAIAVEQTSVGKRLAYQLLYWFGDKKGGILAGIILIPQVMAIFIPAAAVRTAMILPILFSVISILGLQKGDIRGKQLMMAAVIGVNVSGTSILPAAIGNVVTVDLVNYYLKQHVTFFDWLILSLPMWLIMIPVTWWILYRCYPSKEEIPQGLKEKMKDMITELGPITSKEKRLMWILGGVSVLWAMEGIHGWPPVIPALIGVALMAWPGIKITEWEKLMEINFGPLMLLGVTLSLGRALYETGVVDLLSKWLENDFTLFLFSNPSLAVVTVVIMTQLIHKVTSNVSTAVIATVPVAIALSSHAQHAPVLLLAILAGMTSLYGFLLVVETIPGVLVYNTGWITQRDFLRTGVWLTLVHILLCFIFAQTWWSWLGYI